MPDKKENSEYYSADKHFYICSYGGCGSWMLVDYLSNFGNAYHVHSRYPPKELTYIGPDPKSKKSVKSEWFNDIKIPAEELHKYKVIFIYKNPIQAIFSRFFLPQHLENIHCDPKLTFLDLIESKRDLYGIGNFFSNYVEKKERNYDIYCVKYESFFDNIEKFNEMMGIENCPELYPKKKETRRDEILLRIYYNLIKKMESMDFITVSPRSDVASAAAAPQKEEQKSVLPTSAAKKPMNLIFNTDPLGNAK